jgi:hypothetical protein
MTDAALFISDLHLTPERPLPVRLFYRFIREVAPHAQALYVLGDFLEAWVGDDALLEPFYRDLATALKSLSEQGVLLFSCPVTAIFWSAHPFPTPLDSPSCLIRAESTCSACQRC